MLDWLKNLFEDRLFGAQRSPGWPKLRREHLAKNPFCKVCGTVKDLEVHHVFPVHKFPEMELDPLNLITLCGSGKNDCHRIFGHLFDYKSYNDSIVSDARGWYTKAKKRP